jgi:hypothetical protein
MTTINKLVDSTASLASGEGPDIIIRTIFFLIAGTITILYRGFTKIKQLLK